MTADSMLMKLVLSGKKGWEAFIFMPTDYSNVIKVLMSAVS